MQQRIPKNPKKKKRKLSRYPEKIQKPGVKNNIIRGNTLTLIERERTRTRERQIKKKKKKNINDVL
jgi:hypothetical protein